VGDAGQRTDPIIDDLISASGFDVGFDVGTLLRELFVHDAFYGDAAGTVREPDAAQVDQVADRLPDHDAPSDGVKPKAAIRSSREATSCRSTII
jgi:hypothetical protein